MMGILGIRGNNLVQLKNIFNEFGTFCLGSFSFHLRISYKIYLFALFGFESLGH